MDGNVISPTIGRVVWYCPRDNEGPDIHVGDQMHAADVCYVWNDTMVNLSIKDANGNQYSRTSVELFQGSPEDCPQGACCWMPYQKQQAAKEAA